MLPYGRLQGIVTASTNTPQSCHDCRARCRKARARCQGGQPRRKLKFSKSFTRYSGSPEQQLPPGYKLLLSVTHRAHQPSNFVAFGTCSDVVFISQHHAIVASFDPSLHNLGFALASLGRLSHIYKQAGQRSDPQAESWSGGDLSRVCPDASGHDVVGEQSTRADTGGKKVTKSMPRCSSVPICTSASQIDNLSRVNTIRPRQWV
jgi:hypothetical protein